jgi:hypothetical protein
MMPRSIQGDRTSERMPHEMHFPKLQGTDEGSNVLCMLSDGKIIAQGREGCLAPRCRVPVGPKKREKHKCVEDAPCRLRVICVAACAALGSKGLEADLNEAGDA